jgi:hypothetical protein
MHCGRFLAVFLTFMTSSSLFSRLDRALLLLFTVALPGFIFVFVDMAAKGMTKAGPKW